MSYFCTKIHLYRPKYNGSGVILHKTNLTFICHPRSYFWVFLKMALTKVVHPLGIHEQAQFHSPTLSGLNLHPPQKFERPPFEMVKAMELKHGIRVP
jgi:hypothetical protein